MSKVQRVRSYEYKNDYLYIIIRQAPELGAQTYLYCCGINTSRFDPICWGKAGICSNPAFKGLQLLLADMSGFALKRKFATKPYDGNDCGSITPRGDGWYRENMLVAKASPRNAQEALEFSVTDLIKTVLAVCAPDAKIPAKLPNPPAMQKWLDSFNVKNYIALSSSSIARRR
jgi:hypothetical protein